MCCSSWLVQKFKKRVYVYLWGQKPGTVVQLCPWPASLSFSVCRTSTPWFILTQVAEYYYLSISQKVSHAWYLMGKSSAVLWMTETSGWHLSDAKHDFFWLLLKLTDGPASVGPASCLVYTGACEPWHYRNQLEFYHWFPGGQKDISSVAICFLKYKTVLLSKTIEGKAYVNSSSVHSCTISWKRLSQGGLL